MRGFSKLLVKLLIMMRHQLTRSESASPCNKSHRTCVPRHVECDHPRMQQLFLIILPMEGQQEGARESALDRRREILPPVRQIFLPPLSTSAKILLEQLNYVFKDRRKTQPDFTCLPLLCERVFSKSHFWAKNSLVGTVGGRFSVVA